MKWNGTEESAKYTFIVSRYFNAITMFLTLIDNVELPCCILFQNKNRPIGYPKKGLA